MQRQELEGLSREQLIALAERIGIPRPRVLTQPELVDEIIGRTATNEREKAKARGWLGRARDLLARVVERGLHLPEAARVLRSSAEERTWPSPPEPLATVTLAEIYAAQGHLDRAINVLNEVLARDPHHQEALALRARFSEQSRARARGGRGAPVEAPPEPAPQAKPAEAGAEMAKPTPNPDPQAPRAPEEPQEEGKTTAPPATRIETEEPAAKPEPRAADKASVASAEAPPAEAAAPAPAAAQPHEEAAAVDEALLPERYNVDEVVAIAVDPLTIYLYWEVRARTLARAQALRPDGWLGIRIVTVLASWSGPQIRIKDMRIDALYGDRFVREVEPGSNVRVSVGWKSGGDFEPFAVGVEVTVPHLTPMASVAQEVATWAPQSSQPEEPWRSVTPGALAALEPPRPSPWPLADRAPRERMSRKAPQEPPADHGVARWTDSAPAPTEAFSTSSTESFSTSTDFTEPGPAFTEVFSTFTEWGPWTTGSFSESFTSFSQLIPSFSESFSESFITLPESFATFSESFTTWSEALTSYTYEDMEQTEGPSVFDVFEWSETTLAYLDAWLSPAGASELARGRGSSHLFRRGSSQLVRRGSSRLSRRGASELARRGASELMRRGGSELSRGSVGQILRAGASELMRRGGSELSRLSTSELFRLGASDIVRRGASELLRRGASELFRRGGSELSRRGGSELSRGGGSELSRKLP